MKTKHTEYEKQKVKEMRKVLFDCAPLIMAFAAAMYLMV